MLCRFSTVDAEKDLESRAFASKYGRIHYLFHKGTGPTIILLHGFAGSWKSWTRLVQHLPKEFSLYILDLLGHGDSEAPEADYSLRMHYEILKELIDREKIGAPYLMGHSYGGWLAAYYAIREDVGGIILEDSAGLQEFVNDRRDENPNYREDLVSEGLVFNTREGVLRRMIGVDNTDALLTPSNLGTIESGALIIWGGNDATVKVKYAKIFHKAISGSKLFVLENEGHTPHYTNPQAVADLVVGFVLG